jgi:TPP-dependent pyruvate/acetoin dehydrogenase alpha subunit
MHLKLDRAYKKDIETTERTISDSILIGRKKLMEKSKLQVKTEARAEEEKEEEVKEGVEQEEEGKVDYE